jgi:hypothetical protein
MDGACSTYGGEERRILNFGWKPEGKRPLEKPTRRWEGIVRMDLQQGGCRGTDWIELAQDSDRCRALMSAVMNLRIP